MRPNEVGRFARTVVHVPPLQILHRLRLRAQKQGYRLAPTLTARVFGAGAIVTSGWPRGFTALDAVSEAVGRPSLEENRHGRFSLLDHAADLGRPIDWQPVEEAQLWRYHLHYFDWAWVLHDNPTPDALGAFAELYRSWRDANPIGQWDAWSPYVVALRSWTMCSVAAIVPLEGRLLAELEGDLARHARYLRANIEFDVGGNHVVKNLKALVGLGVYLGDQRLLRYAARHLHQAVEHQVLSDGGHFERSPGYHAQVLGDLIDVCELLGAASLAPGLVRRLRASIAAMRHWLQTVQLPDGRIPALNDSMPVSDERLSALSVIGHSSSPFELLEASGYAVVRPRPGTCLIVDVGPPCPPELPAHAQADALALTVQIDGEDVLLDTGTSTYAAGERRQYERSTSAHNTLEIDGVDQTEVWGSFRAGRRHAVTVHHAAKTDEVHVVDASHDGYRHLPGAPVHRRRVTTSATHVDVVDRITGTGVHDLVAYWHLAPSATWDADSRMATTATAVLRFDLPPGATAEFIPAGDSPLGVVAKAHNVLVDAPCLVITLAASHLPAESRTRISY